MLNKQIKKQKIMSSIGIIVGVIILIVGILIFTGETSLLRSPSHSIENRYGGDFYTEMSADMHDITDGLCKIYQLIKTIGGIIIISIGAITVLKNVKELFNITKEDSYHTQNIVNEESHEELPSI